MDLDSIRSMSDNELRSFMNNLAQRNNIFCTKCGNIIPPRDRYNLNISVYDTSTCQKQRKLCSLCYECYIDLLDYLAVSDINWDE